MTTPRLETPPATSSETAAEAPPQFRLIHLFWATLVVALITLIAMNWGRGSLIWSTGITLAWLNVWGWFSRVQQPHRRPRLAYAAWLLLAVSLILPSAKGCNQKRIRGWEATQMVVIAEATALENLARGEESLDVSKGVQLLHLTLINLANLLCLASPLFLRRLQKGKGQILGNTLAIAIVAVWLLAWGDGSGFLIGYYLWALGMTLLLHMMRLKWPMAVAMTLLGPVMLLVAD